MFQQNQEIILILVAIIYSSRIYLIVIFIEKKFDYIYNCL